MKKRLAILALLVGLAAISFAQQDRQPRGKAETMVQGKKVVIDYGRPALKGRSLDELMNSLPEDRIWRAGENQVTTLETATDLKIGGTAIPAGKYSLYVHAPAEGNWALCVNKNLGIELGKIYAQAPPEMAKEMWPRLDGYQKNIAGDEVARIPMMSGSEPASDVFTIGLSPSELTMAWGEQSWKVGLE
jgi:hypothetical protein